MPTNIASPSSSCKHSFACIDVETANFGRESICQIGIVTILDGSIAATWDSLVDPEDWFDSWNKRIHGISEDMVQGAPTFPEIYGEIQNCFADQIVVSHTAFDRVAIQQATYKYDLPFPSHLAWLDSARVARRAWPDLFAEVGCGLENVATELGIAFKHHDALEDARAASEVILRACAETGLNLNEWLKRVEQPIRPYLGELKPEANKDGPLIGEHVVFTGDLSVPRGEATRAAAAEGCQVQTSVTKKTTMLVVGIQDKRKLDGYDKSGKHRKAEKLIEGGQNIEILSEDNFWAVIENK